MSNKVIHPFTPIYNEKSKIMFIGSVASIKSRELGYPYASPQNRFWKVMEALFDENIVEYKEFLLRHNIALWDAIKSCDIIGSSDASIKNIKINEIWKITDNSNIKVIFANGKKAFDIYQKYIYPKTKISAICLPSTSPANAVKSLEDLINDYKIIFKYL